MDSRRVTRKYFPRSFVVTIVALLCIARGEAEISEPWQDRLLRTPAIAFPEYPNFRATYRFGWSGLTAAEATVNFQKKPEIISLRAEGGSVGVVARLWPMQAVHEAQADRFSLAPLRLHQNESYRSKNVETKVSFYPERVERLRLVKPAGQNPAKVKKFQLAHLHHLLSAVLLLRRQHLVPEAAYTFLVFPGDSAYLASLKVRKRCVIQVAEKAWPALECELEIKRVASKGPGKGTLQNHDKYRRGRFWVSDDGLRLPLKAEVDVFIGTVFGELVEFSPHSSR